ATRSVLVRARARAQARVELDPSLPATQVGKEMDQAPHPCPRACPCPEISAHTTILDVRRTGVACLRVLGVLCVKKAAITAAFGLFEPPPVRHNAGRQS